MTSQQELKAVKAHWPLTLPFVCSHNAVHGDVKSSEHFVHFYHAKKTKSLRCICKGLKCEGRLVDVRFVAFEGSPGKNTQIVIYFSFFVIFSKCQAGRGV